MRIIIQRVNCASVEIGGELFSAINAGLLVLAGFESADTDEDIAWMTKKLVQIRIFDDAEGVMNLSVKDMNGEILLVSQFTLHAMTKKGNRPSYINAAPPAIAIPLYEKFISEIEKELGKPIKTGKFGAMMNVKLENSGPVTIWIDSKNKD